MAAPLTIPGKSSPPQAAGSASWIWTSTAAIAALFCVAVAVAMASSTLALRTGDPVKEPQLVALKKSLALTPTDDALKETIRRRDLEVRASYFRALSTVTNGAYLLAGGGLLLLLALKKRSQLSVARKGPIRRTGRDYAGEVNQWRNWSWWSILGTGTACGLLLVGLSLTARSYLPGALKKSAAAGGGAEPVQAIAPLPTPEEVARNWPQFRGPGGLAFSADSNAPIAWDGKSGAGILWTNVVPAHGFNSPIIWGERVFCSGGDKTNREVYAFNLGTGELLWRRQVKPAPNEAGWELPEQSGIAASSMATDGRVVVAMFANGELAAFKMDGEPAWSKSLGLPKNAYGHANSLAAFEGRVLVQFDQGETEDKLSKLIALDGLTGKVVWERPRPVASSWASPVVVQAGGKAQIITVAVPFCIGYSASDGAELWRVNDFGGEVTPSPGFAGGLVLAVNPSDKVVAIRPDGQGDVTKTHVAWTAEENVPDITSPASNGELVFTVNTMGMLTCLDAKTGKKVWEQDLGQEFQASPAIVGNRIYLFSMKGLAVVVEAGRQFKELSRTEMGDKFLASPAFAQGRLVVRGATNLYCIGSSAAKLAQQ